MLSFQVSVHLLFLPMTALSITHKQLVCEYIGIFPLLVHLLNSSQALQNAWEFTSVIHSAQILEMETVV